MTIKAIETRYAGCRFRSRLEARWAVFFDHLGIKWEYEPEGYLIEGNRPYLPDFHLPQLEVWAEVKGNMATFNIHQAAEAAAGLGELVVLGGIPRVDAPACAPIHPTLTAAKNLRVGPYDIAMEQSLLGGILLGSEMPQIGVPQGELVRAFWRAAHQLIYSSILQVHERGKPTDVTNVFDELSRTGDLKKVGGETYLSALLECEGQRLDDAAEQICKLAAQRNEPAVTLNSAMFAVADDGSAEIVRVLPRRHQAVEKQLHLDQRHPLMVLHTQVERAYAAGRSARFEYGQTPKVPSEPRSKAGAALVDEGAVGDGHSKEIVEAATLIRHYKFEDQKNVDAIIGEYSKPARLEQLIWPIIGIGVVMADIAASVAAGTEANGWEDPDHFIDHILAQAGA